MKKLRELNIEDTQLALIHLQTIFNDCSKLVKLSFSLTNTKELKGNEKFLTSLSQGFGRLTDLKIFICTLDDRRYIEAWLAIFDILKYVDRFII